VVVAGTELEVAETVTELEVEPSQPSPSQTVAEEVKVALEVVVSDSWLLVVV